MKRVLAGLAAGAVWLWAAAPAMAQPTYDELTDDQLSELYCVADYLDIFTGASGVVDAYISTDPDDEAYVQMDADVQDASDTCAEEYGWSDENAETMTMIGLYALIGDEMELRLGGAGVNEEGLDAIYSTAELLPDGDLGLFADGTWFDNTALRQRVTDALGKKGVGGDAVITNAMYLMEAYIMVAVTLEDWLSTQADS